MMYKNTKFFKRCIIMNLNSMSIMNSGFHSNYFALAIVAKSPQSRRTQGLRERQCDRRKHLTATMSPAANDCGLEAESATAKPERPKRKYGLTKTNPHFLVLLSA